MKTTTVTTQFGVHVFSAPEYPVLTTTVNENGSVIIKDLSGTLLVAASPPWEIVST